MSNELTSKLPHMTIYPVREAVSYVCLSKPGRPARERINVCEWCFCLQMHDPNHNDVGSHTGVSGSLFASPAVLCNWLLELISVFFSWKMHNMSGMRLSCCVTQVVYRSGMWFYYVNIWISLMRIFRRCKKSESAPSWCCKSQFFQYIL